MNQKALRRHNWRRTKNEVALQINRILQEKGLTLEMVAEQATIPLSKLEYMSLGHGLSDLGQLHSFVFFLGKRLKIELVDFD